MLINKPQSGVWPYGVLCLCFLAPFFFLTYGFANQYATTLAHVPHIVFAWEHSIPLWPWTIVPYWSIDLFYGLSLLLCLTRHELRQQVLRLVSAQVFAISCFLLFPLKFSFERSELTGFFGVWFDILMGFDKPFNQAPSLHIVLLVILWDFYRRHVVPKWRWIVHVWSLLIGISVLTTWQHHFIDIPTGIIVGALCLWLFPLQGFSPLNIGRQQLTAKHIKLASFYFLGALVFATLAWGLKGWALWLFYPSLSLLLVAIAYVLRQPTLFQKQPDGQISAASYLLFAPYLLFAWLNSRLWTRKHPEDSFIIQYHHLEIYLGRIPTQQQAQHYQVLFDCCAELPHPKTPVQDFEAFYTLDLIPIQSQQLEEAVYRLNHVIQQHAHHLEKQKLLIYCALGYSRSSSILIAWLLQQDIVQTPLGGMQFIQKQRRWIVLKAPQLQQLQRWQEQHAARRLPT